MSKYYLKASILVVLFDVLRFQLTFESICRLEPEEQTCPNQLCDRTWMQACLGMAADFSV